MFSEALLYRGLMHAAMFWTRLVTQTKDAEMKISMVITSSLHDGLFRLPPGKTLGVYFMCYQHMYAGIYF